MPRSTDLPEKILELIEHSLHALSGKDIASRLNAKPRTIDEHLRTLTERGLILRRFDYPKEGNPIGRYLYSARGKNKALDTRG